MNNLTFSWKEELGQNKRKGGGGRKNNKLCIIRMRGDGEIPVISKYYKFIDKF